MAKNIDTTAFASVALFAGLGFVGYWIYKKAMPQGITISGISGYRKKYFGGNSGYYGYSKSNRAIEAEERGLRNKSQMDSFFVARVNRILQLNGYKGKVTLKQIKNDLANINPDEWHHTSMYGNKTNYYSPETIASYYCDIKVNDPEIYAYVPKNIIKMPNERYIEETDMLEIGDRVKHNTFGFGVVKDIYYRENHKIAEVEFENVGMKQLVVKYVRLTKI